MPNIIEDREVYSKWLQKLLPGDFVSLRSEYYDGDNKIIYDVHIVESVSQNHIILEAGASLTFNTFYRKMNGTQIQLGGRVNCPKDTYYIWPPTPREIVTYRIKEYGDYTLLDMLELTKLHDIIVPIEYM